MVDSWGQGSAWTRRPAAWIMGLEVRGSASRRKRTGWRRRRRRRIWTAMLWESAGRERRPGLLSEPGFWPREVAIDKRYYIKSHHKNKNNV